MGHRIALREWQKRIDAFERAIAGKLPAPIAIQRHLEALVEGSSEIHGLRVKINQGAVGFESGKLGRCSGGASLKVTEHLSGSSGTTAKITVEAWADEKKYELVGSDFNSLIEVLNEFWMPDQRHERFGNLNLKSPEVKKRLSTIELPSGEGLFVIYLDLVGFKQVNEEITEAGGDDLIARVGGSALALSTKYPIIFTNDGGDEFVAFVLSSDLNIALSFLWELRETAPQKNPNKADEQIRFTAGIEKLDGQISPDSISRARARASEVAKSQIDRANPRLKKKKRDCVTLVGAEPRRIKPTNQTTLAKLVCSLIKARQRSTAPFANTALNVISSRCRDAWVDSGKLSDLRNVAEQSVAWLNLQEVQGADESEFIGQSHWNTKVSSMAVLVAAAHGILSAIKKGRSNPSLFIRVEKKGKWRPALYSGKKRIMGNASSSPTDIVGIGTSLKAKGDVSESQKFSPVIKLCIGVSDALTTGGQAEVPADLFADCIIVDDRPHIGGGLPDFWQSAFAQLLQALNDAPHANRLLVWGNKKCAPQVMSRLKNGVSAKDVEVLTSITGLPVDAIRRNLRRIALPRFVAYVDDAATAISILHSAYQELSEIRPPIKSSQSIVGSLQIELRDSDFRLRREDGLRCATAAEAYPIVLNTFKSSEEIATTFDDAAQQLQELLGFKIVLSNPLRDPIPAFWSDEQKSMDNYWKTVLLPASGMISSSFCKNGQYAKVVKFLSKYCGAHIDKQSTRRAVIVVPNNFHADDPKPLGLISVWATPRSTADGRVQIHFSFVWRTVEAFVGLPYSLFGSIRLAERIVEDVLNSQNNLSKKKIIEIGTLTYSALSLHMRKDHFHQRISKKIVASASK